MTTPQPAVLPPHALALISLGIAELWSLRLQEAEAHLERGIALAHRIGRPLLEINGLAHWGLVASFRSPALAVERGLQAIGLAQRHGWGGEPLVAIAYPMLAGSLIWQGEPGEAERWLMEGRMRSGLRSSRRQECCSMWFGGFSRALAAVPE